MGQLFTHWLSLDKLCSSVSSYDVFIFNGDQEFIEINYTESYNILSVKFD